MDASRDDREDSAGAAYNPSSVLESALTDEIVQRDFPTNSWHSVEKVFAEGALKETGCPT